ncbi:Aldo reductase [Venustampulla echinocandica]|uniref:Aldo reductase n=1 Tax=Venustampulla echinocandica TaxID=2656787 RepID=A0A370TVN6_9HELO|nr:Aldo reductase [Venustampulla echinocandica]RDL39569.1 Aldo reductase [Venustampulla echinocandica]
MGKDIPMLKLHNGVQMPALGFGTFSSENVPGQMRAAVLAALETGRESSYKNEDEVGSALQQWLSQNPKVKREDIFITTKVWPHLMEPDDVEWSLNSSLERLGTDYVDAYLLHWPFSVEKTEDHQVKLGDDQKYILKPSLTSDLRPTWRAMEKLYRLGKARSIGVSNWTIPLLEKLLTYAEIPPAINQVEIHPYFPNTRLVNFCFGHGILPVAYSPLGSQGQVKENKRERVSDDPKLKAIAEQKGSTVAQVLIAWGVKRGYAVVPKSANEERIRSNFGLLDLSDEEFQAVNSVVEGRGVTRFVNPRDMFGYDVWAGEDC